MRRRLCALVGTLAMLLASTLPASAIVYGQPDTNNDYANVGALIGEFDVNGVPTKFIVCSGTLIEDGDTDPASSNLFLTAAHCIFSDRMWVSFDNDLDTVPPFGAVAPHEPLLAGTAHPHTSFACCGNNDTFDIAVVELDTDVVGITPAPVATPNQLGTMSSHELRSATFTTAGYGAVRDTRVKAWQSLFDPEGERSWATQSALSLTKAWFTLSMNQATRNGGTCYGDSGGPHFLGDTVVSLTVTGDVFCKATDKTYRVDTPAAQAFLAGFIGGD